MYRPQRPGGADLVVRILVLAGVPAATIFAIATGRLNVAALGAFVVVLVYLVWTDRLG